MPKRKDISCILIIGSGPIVIGQACEFDYSGSQAVRALKESGYRVVLINSNPATIMTDSRSMADATYIEPMTLQYVEKIIETEKVDAILPTVGGQTALNLTISLEEQGILEKHDVELIGANTETIKMAEDRHLFAKIVEEIGYRCPPNMIISKIEEAEDFLHIYGLPAIIRPSFTLAGSGGGIANTEEEFWAMVKQGLQMSPIGEIQIDKSLIGWQEFELEVVRDQYDNCMVVCAIENIDPMGIHTGDSITVAPAMTLLDKEYQRMRDMAIAILRKIKISAGGANVQFAINPKDKTDVYVIEANPRVSRSSALASKATGFPIANVAAKLAVGYSLQELPNACTPSIPASFEPSMDYVVIKVPRFDFNKFPTVDAVLFTAMQSVGEVMAIGRTFQETIQKAMNSLESDHIEGLHTRHTNKKILIPSENCYLHEIKKFLSNENDLEDMYRSVKNRFIDEICKNHGIQAHNLANHDLLKGNLGFSQEENTEEFAIPSKLIEKIEDIDIEIQNKLKIARRIYIKDRGFSDEKSYWMDEDNNYINNLISLILKSHQDTVFQIFNVLRAVSVFERKYKANKKDYYVKQISEKLGYNEWFLYQFYIIADTEVWIQSKIIKRSRILIEMIDDLYEKAVKDVESDSENRSAQIIEYMEQYILGSSEEKTLLKVIKNILDYATHNYTEEEKIHHSWWEFFTKNTVMSQAKDIETEHKLSKFMNRLTHRIEEVEHNPNCSCMDIYGLKKWIHNYCKRKEKGTFCDYTAQMPIICLLIEVFFLDYEILHIKKQGFSNEILYDLVRASIEESTNINKYMCLTYRDDMYHKFRNFPDANIYSGIRNNANDPYKDIVVSQLTQSIKSRNILSVYKKIDTCAGEFETDTNYLYSTYEGSIATAAECESNVSEKRKIIIIGSGPNRIGQGIEFDCICVHACQAFRNLGFETIMINCNPETVSTDYIISDKLYFEPLTPERIIDILDKESSNGQIEGVVVQLGGQTPLKLANYIADSGYKILGTEIGSINISEDRDRFRTLLQGMDVAQPKNEVLTDMVMLPSVVKKVGLPVIVRPSNVLSGQNMKVLYTDEDVENYQINSKDITPVLVEQFIDNAIELDVDAVSICNGVDDECYVNILGIMEHIEEAGIHSGDSSSFIPTNFVKNNKKMVEKIENNIELICKKLQIKGLVNAQFMVNDDNLYIIEINPRASRTIPFIAKYINSDIGRIISLAMLGNIEELRKEKIKSYKDRGLYAVKSSVFPFAKFKDVDILLGPEMKSTGEVMGIESDLGSAFAKAQISANNFPFNPISNVFLSVKNPDKNDCFIEMVKGLCKLKGIRIISTEGTGKYIKQYIEKDIEIVGKVSENDTNIISRILEGKIDLVINTSEGKKDRKDSQNIRKIALLKRIPHATNLRAAKAIVDSILKLKNNPIENNLPIYKIQDM